MKNVFEVLNKSLSRIILVSVCTLMLSGTASAALEITDFFSDYTTSEVTIKPAKSIMEKQFSSFLMGRG